MFREIIIVTLLKKDANGNVIKQAEYIEVSTEQGKALEADVRAALFQYKKNGVDGYAERTDEEIEDAANDILKARRYSKRARYAINTGIAANRDIIGQLTNEEEYLFAASLGKFKEGERPPEYGDTIKYGTKPLKDYYIFEDITDSDTFAEKAGTEAKEQTDNLLNDENNKYGYYLKNPDYKKAYDAAYNAYIKRKEKEYEDKYTNLINNASDDAVENWRGGGKNYRELFLEFLRDRETFSYTDIYGQKLEGVYFCTTIAARLIDYYNKSIDGNSTNDISIARAIYEILIDPQNPTVENEKDRVYHNQFGYYYGLYPAMAFKTLEIAKLRRATSNIFVRSKWEAMGYDKAQYPEFDNLTQDLAVFERSFNEMLFSSFYYVLRDNFTKIVNNTLHGDDEFLRTKNHDTEEEWFKRVQAKV